MKKSGIIISVIGIFLIGVILVISNYTAKNKGNKQTTTTTTTTTSEAKPQYTETVDLVPTMDDVLVSDAAWTPTFQIVWNDLKNESVKTDIMWDSAPAMVSNLNKESFKKTMLNDKYYYSKFGYKTLALKEEIEKAIKQKFNQESDILDLFDWSDEEVDPGAGDIRRLFFYSMLYKEFKFEEPFDKFEKLRFRDVENIDYFGIAENGKEPLLEQVEVLYYNNYENFAVKLFTKDLDEIIVVKNPKGMTFNDIWKNISKEEENFNGNKVFTSKDVLKIPNLKFDVLREYTELEHNNFYDVTGQHEFSIEKALQTIKFDINNEGGKVKSEAAIDVKDTITAVDPDRELPRDFIFDDTFAMFIKEQKNDYPYVAIRVEDINKYQ